MERVVKFRGKTLSGKWVYGDLVHFTNTQGIDASVIITEHQATAESDDFDYALCYARNEFKIVVPESVGQFIGLHDKNGKEIYEGDIICLCHFFVQYCPYELKPIRGAYDVEVDKDEVNTTVSYKRNYVVEFRPNRGWIVRNGSVHHSLRSYAGVTYGNVIGNIHDNPNLLTDGRD